MILPDNCSGRGYRGRLDAAQAWLSTLGDTPDDVAHALELLCLRGIDDVAESLLAGVACGPRYPVRAPHTPLRWMLPAVFRRPRPGTTALDVRFSVHLAALLGLAVRGDGPAARRILGQQELHLPQRAPWWLTDSLARFTSLTHFAAPGAPWHARATLPARFLVMPSVCELSLAGAELGDHRLARSEWNLPSLVRLSLTENALRAVPDQIMTLHSLEVLALIGNPITEVPAALADLPRLRYVDLRGTGIRSVPKRFKDHGIHVVIGE